MNIQDVDVRRAQVLQGCLDRNSETFGVVSGVVDLVSDIILASLEVGCILSMISVRSRAFNTRDLDLPWLQ